MKSKKLYPCLLICLSYLLVVRNTNNIKYTNKKGQNTGKSKTSNKEQKIEIIEAIVEFYQNLNSLIDLIKGPF